MSIVSPSFRPILDETVAKLKTARTPLESIGTVRVDVRLVGQQSSEARVRNFSFLSDEPASIGGMDRGPTPLDYFAASVGFCENVMFARNAALHGLDFDALETTLHGHWDRKGQYELDGKEPSFIDMTVETKVTTRDRPEKVAEVARRTHRTCPMHATITKAMRVTDRLVVNGKEVSL